MRKYILLFISTLLGTSSALAQTLFDTLANTYETNPTLKASQAYLRSVDERVGQAKSGWRPYIVAQGNISHSDQTFKNYPGLSEDVDYENDAYDAGVVMTQNVFQGFKTWNAVDYAQTIVLQERESVRSTEQNVLLDAATAYVNVIRDRAVLELQKNQEQVLARHLKSYKKRFQVGDLTKTDVAQAEARLEGAKANRILADGNLETSIAAYASVVGNKPDTHMEINDFTKLLPKSLEEALKLMEEHNPAIKSAVFADEAAKHNIGLNRADLMPSLDVKAGAGYQWGQPIPMTGDYDGKYWQVGATLTVPLYQGGGEYSRLREAKQLANVARITLEQTRRDLIKLTTQAWETWQSSKASIVSIKAQIKASKMALDGVIREANVGSRTVLDVLDAEQEHLNYQVNLVRAERDATAAALQLLSAVGKMTAEELKLNVALYNPQDYYKKVNNKWIGGGI